MDKYSIEKLRPNRGNFDTSDYDFALWTGMVEITSWKLRHIRITGGVYVPFVV
jgi:hypothetical protein